MNAPVPKALALLALACGTGPSRVPVTGPASVSAPESDPLRDLSREVSAARQLPVAREVRGSLVRPDQLVARVLAHVKRHVPAEAVAAEGLCKKLLGAFPVTGDYERSTYEILARAAVGFYEPDDATLYLASDQTRPDARATAAHEIVHALQDQRWGLEALTRYVPGEDDAATALSALAEGDATSAAEQVFPAGAPSDDVLREELETQGGDAAEGSLRAALLAPYAAGTLFVRALRRDGGWSEVNEAWAHLPMTTEQILHPDKWRVREEPLRVDAPPPPEDGPPERRADSTYGELNLALALSEWMDGGVAYRIASGWGGDRIALFGDGSSAALAWRIRYDERAFADRAFRALSLALEGMGKRGLASEGRRCVERSNNGVLALGHEGADVVLAVGRVDLRQSAFEARDGCPETLAWVGAILSAP